jgi:hypothetical protein
MGPDPVFLGGGGVRRVVISWDQSIKVPVSAWAAASCSWSRGVCVNGGSGPRPAV